MRLASSCSALVLLVLSAPGCFGNFDHALVGGGVDAGPVDGGPPSIALADFCTDVPATTLSGTAFAIDTSTLHDDVSDLGSCLDRRAPGNDGFLGVMMTMGERWHFHIRQPSGSGVDPMLYILDGCDERMCVRESAIDSCGPDANEHLSFVAPHDGLYYVGVDTAASGGFTGTLEVYHPTCGNGTRQHSENCDDGDLDSGDGCDSLCRTEVTGTATMPMEVEVNDDFYAANHVLGTGDRHVLGEVGARCDVDNYAFDFTAAATVTVTVSARDGAACPVDAPSLELGLFTTAGTPVRTSVAGGCPTMTATIDATGTYFVRIYAEENDAERAFPYELLVTETP